MLTAICYGSIYVNGYVLKDDIYNLPNHAVSHQIFVDAVVTFLTLTLKPFDMYRQNMNKQKTRYGLQI